MRTWCEANWARPRRANAIGPCCYEVLRVIRPAEADGGAAVTEAGEAGEAGAVSVQQDRASVCKGEEVPETDGGGDCITLGMCLLSLHCILKNDKPHMCSMLYVCILSQKRR